jgi:hypothetical protein
MTQATGELLDGQDEPVGAFDPNDYMWEADLKVALKDFETKIPSIDKNWRYYTGDHPKKWLTEALVDMFEKEELPFDMSENWCELAIDAHLKRLSVQGWQTEGNPTGQPAVENVWNDNDLDLEQIDLYRHVRIAGEGFLFVWKDEEKESGYDIAVNDPRNVWWPEDSRRADPRVVIKIFTEDVYNIDGSRSVVWRANVYYRYVVIRLVGPKLREDGMLPQARYFHPDDSDLDNASWGGEHGFERVPVLRFAMSKKRRSILDTICPVQDRINKLESQKMVAAEWGAFRRLALLTKQQVKDGDVSFRPNNIPVLDPGGDENTAPTQIWEGTATELSNYDLSIQKEINKLFSMAHLPSHMQVKESGTAPSGEEREADEGDFVEAIHDMQRHFEASWVDLWKLIFGDIDVKPSWVNPQMKSDKTEAETVKTFKDATVPLEIILRKYAGWTDEELKELEKQKEKALAMLPQPGGEPPNGTTEEDQTNQSAIPPGSGPLSE